MSQLSPFFENVQAHYDVSDAFYALFLDPSLTYSCAYFEPESATLEEAQRAKIDLSLGKCDLHPGMRLLDIGCGWGATARRAAERYGAEVIGLTLSRNQAAYVESRARAEPPPRGRIEVRLQGWEEFREPVDRIVSIGAFEHFRYERYGAFFQRCHELLPPGGRMLLHTITADLYELDRAGIPLTPEDVQFVKFIAREIFPGGQLPRPGMIRDFSRHAGFTLEREQSLQPHYARTLECWGANLAARREEAIAVASEEVYRRYERYLAGCAQMFRERKVDVRQFTLVRA